MGAALSAEQIREARIYAAGFEAGKKVALRAAARARRPPARNPGLAEHVARGEAALAEIVREIAARRGVAAAELAGRGRPHKLARARDLVCFLAARLGGLSSPQIGRAFGGRDHTTILFAVERFAALAAREPERIAEAREIARALGLDLPRQEGIER